jgi:hypothetical protein
MEGGYLFGDPEPLFSIAALGSRWLEIPLMCPSDAKLMILRHTTHTLGSTLVEFSEGAL